MVKKHVSDRNAAEEMEISQEDYRELKRRIKDSEDPVRYVVATTPFGDRSKRKRWQLYLDVGEETWCSDLESATVFKRLYYAEAILEAYSRSDSEEDSDKKRIRSEFIVKITTKNQKRKILKYLEVSES